MAKILGISGSLRANSFNSALLRAAMGLMPEGSPLEIASIAGIPLYNGDEEATGGIPKPVSALKERFVAADGVLIATPEYNNSIPGVAKNAFDWLSRPPSDVPKVFGGRAIAIIGASPGPYGTLLSQNAWLSVVRTLRMRPWFGGRLLVAHADKVFNDAGDLVDEAVRKQLERFVAGFAEFAGQAH